MWFLLYILVQNLHFILTQANFAVSAYIKPLQAVRLHFVGLQQCDKYIPQLKHKPPGPYSQSKLVPL